MGSEKASIVTAFNFQISIRPVNPRARPSKNSGLAWDKKIRSWRLLDTVLKGALSFEPLTWD